MYGEPHGPAATAGQRKNRSAAAISLIEAPTAEGAELGDSGEAQPRERGAGATDEVVATPVAVRSGPSDAARKRAAVELIREQGATLRRTARRYSICEPDAEDAYQRALEILLRKAPTDDPRDLIRWMQVVTKHEALAVRRNRERMLPSPALQAPGGDDGDWVQQLPSERDGPLDRAERQERISRAREALQALKPQELRALTLLAEGYSYSEIRQQTGWTYTKTNRATWARLAREERLLLCRRGLLPAALSGRPPLLAATRAKRG
jgi:RNA polymerase sigma factor (sigma-70 family)